MKNILIKKNNSLKEALYKLNTSGEKCLIIVNDKNKLIGTLSDGDLRKGLLLGSNLNEKISKIYNKNPTFLYDKELNNDDIKKIFIKYKFDLLPIVKKNKQVKDYLTWTSFLTNSQKIQKSKIKQFVVTNSIDNKQKTKGSKIKIISVASLLGEAINRISESRSVSKLFK